MTAVLTRPVVAACPTELYSVHRTLQPSEARQIAAHHRDVGLVVTVVDGTAHLSLPRRLTAVEEVQILREVARFTDQYALHEPPLSPKERAEIALATLGDTKEMVGSRLLKQQVSGVRGDAHFCPIAVFLRRRGLPVDEVMPSDDPRLGVVEFDAVEADGVWAVPTLAELPAAVNEFANAFDEDEGFFPELVAGVVA